MIRTLFFCAALAGLSACGFRPLYAGSSFNGVESPIQVTEIPGRSGYQLRQNLLRELSAGLPGLTEPAILTVNLNETLTRATLLPDGAVARSFYDATGSYALATESRVITGDAGTQVPYAATEAPYADVSAQINSSEQGMRDLARRIVENLRIQVQAGQ